MGSRATAPLILDLSTVDVNGQRQAPADLPLGERTPQCPLNRRTCELRVNLDILEMRKIAYLHWTLNRASCST